MKISLMNNYKYNNNNNNNNNNNLLYLSVTYFSYEANWGTYEIKRYNYMDSNKIKYLQLKRKNK